MFLCVKVPESPAVNIKSAVSCDNPHQQISLPPQPTLIQPTALTQDIPWNHPGGVIICGAPEVPPFSTLPTMSSLVNDTLSPNHSRSTSPHRTLITARPTSITQNQRPPTTDIITTQLNSMDLHPTTNSFSYPHPSDNLKVQNEEVRIF